jgi:hypothetical protein
MITATDLLLWFHTATIPEVLLWASGFGFFVAVIWMCCLPDPLENRRNRG